MSKRLYAVLLAAGIVTASLVLSLVTVGTSSIATACNGPSAAANDNSN